MAAHRSTLLTRPSLAFAALLLAALLLRGSTFGDPNLHGDEVFYHTVGLAMHHGAVPYIDIWDRKPFGLFALYYLITGLSPAPLAYQLAACLFAAGTAATITAMARRWAEPAGAWLAGLAYLLWLSPMQGFGGQSPVFYNLFIALAGLLVLRCLPALRHGRATAGMIMAMLLAGIGITIKTTALFEGLFMGLFGLLVLRQSEASASYILRSAAVWAFAGAAPALLIAGGYAAAGYWPEYWHAMVTANLDKPIDLHTSLIRLGIMALLLLPFLLLALVGIRRGLGGYGAFIGGWLLAAIVGLAAVPHFYLHYGIPLLVPLCLAAAPVLGKGLLGRVTAVIIALFSLMLSQPFAYDHPAASQRALDQVVSDIRRHSAGRGLMTYEGPSQLYHLSGMPFATPLVFPTHLSALIEKDTSHLSTLSEMRRALAARPGVVVMADPIRNGPINQETYRLVINYTRAHCRLIGKRTVLEWQQDITLAIWGDCNPG